MLCYRLLTSAPALLPPTLPHLQMNFKALTLALALSLPLLMANQAPTASAKKCQIVGRNGAGNPTSQVCPGACDATGGRCWSGPADVKGDCQSCDTDKHGNTNNCESCILQCNADGNCGA